MVENLLGAIIAKREDRNPAQFKLRIENFFIKNKFNKSITKDLQENFKCGKFT